MTKRADLLALAERVEGLTGADREVDADICLALGLSGGNPIKSPGCEGWLVGSDQNQSPVMAMAFTSSLDAAMTLVPEGMVVCIVNGDMSSATPSFERCTALVDDPSKTGFAPVSAMAMPLALTAACLRALAEKEA